MKRYTVKLSLNIVMTIGFVLMFKQNVLGLFFHLVIQNMNRNKKAVLMKVEFTG